MSGSVARLELICQARTIVEALPLDLDHNGTIDESELQAGQSGLAVYVLEHYQLFPARDEGLDGVFDPARALRGKQVEARLIPAS